jgi:ATP-dependent Clp protease ATP-binding subunit ClpC
LSVPESSFILNRLLVTEDIVKSLQGVVIAIDGVVPEYNQTVTLGSLWKLFYENSESFQKMLLEQKVSYDIFDTTCDWLDRLLEDEKRNSAWWWRENLSKTRGVAKSLSYGSASVISKYSRELVMSTGNLGKIQLHRNAIIKLEDALAKKQGANAVIVGGRGTGRHTVVSMLSKMIDQGDCYAEIEHKRMFEFDNNVLGALDQGELISVLGRCFEEAAMIRNIIFVFNDIPALYDMAQKEGVDLFQIIERYINNSDVSVVCISDQSFYQSESHKALFDRDFEVIHIEDMNSKLLIPYIQDNAMIVERRTGKFFPAYTLHTIAQSLTRYFVEDSPLVKADDLLYKIATSATNSQQIIMDDATISETIKSITGVQTGEIHEDEKEKLLNLEAILHEKVMGQDEAIKIVASTMRRSRAGLTSSTKPIGSFLFLGPTGVGKTETAKTLASVFFGSEDHMSRIDMNEYTMNDSSYRLLGDANQEGDIAKLIHSRPYGVLLLDEFEKATTDVKDIFLRILDEGVFTNGAGKVISARTQIVIATSNAGSSFIQESGLHAGSTKEEIDTIKNKLIEAIVSEGLFRPELINRFDAVVLFHPLGGDSRTLIARKMLEALKKRALDQGYSITFTDALVEKVVGSENNASFGGRAIQRNIQSEVEEALARKIIEGSLKVGDQVVIDASDIA